MTSIMDKYSGLNIHIFDKTIGANSQTIYPQMTRIGFFLPLFAAAWIQTHVIRVVPWTRVFFVVLACH